MRVFVTGGAGFIGRAFVRELVEAGHRVEALARRPSSAPDIPGVHWIEGDLARSDGLDGARQALAATDAVAHLAAVRKDWGLSEAELHRVNVASGVELLALARTASRFLYVSSVAVYGHSYGVATTEASGFAPSKRYGVSKVEAERSIVAAARSARLPLTIARPGVVYGPGDTYGMVANLTRLLARRRFALVGSGRSRLNFLYIDDLAIALARTLDVDQAADEDFILAGPEPVAVGTLVRVVSSALGIQPPRLSVPEWAGRAVAFWLERGYRLLGIASEPFLTKAKVDLFTCDDLYDTAKARERLGFAPETSLERGIEATVAWLREHGEIPP